MDRKKNIRLDLLKKESVERMVSVLEGKEDGFFGIGPYEPNGPYDVRVFAPSREMISYDP